MGDLQPLRPLCPESIRWAASQMSAELLALGLNYSSDGPLADFARATNKRLSSAWNRLEDKIRDKRCRLFYFGTWGEPGHFWFNEHGASITREERLAIPTGYPDGNYQPDNGQEMHVAALRHVEGWTILAWWDRTVDKRSSSCGALVWEGEATFETMVKLLERFPTIHKRVMPLRKWHGKTKKEAGRR